MAVFGAKRLSLLALLVLFAQSVEGKTDLRTAENQCFEIVGFDARSVRYVDELSEFVIETTSQYLGDAGHEFSRRIW